MLEDIKIQSLSEDDLPAMLELQRMAYVPELHEPQTLFTAMITFPRSVCLGITKGDVLRGYVLGYAADPEREDVQVARMRRLADEAGLDPVFGEKFLRFVIDEVIRHHLQVNGEEQ